MFGLNGKLKAHPGQRDALADLLLEGAAFLRSLEGCYIYTVYTVADDSDSVYVFEVWRSPEEHQASLTHDEVQQIIAAARPLMAGAPDGTPIMPLGGVGLPE